MAIPILDLNLTSPPNLWRQHHVVLGWAALALGAAALVLSGAVSFAAYREASLEGRNAVLKTVEAKEVIRKQQAIEDRLRSVNVEKELPIWRLAERILLERSLPWSRLTAELERSLVQDVRITSLQRTRNAAQSVELRIAGEARTRAAEENFVASLRENPFFSHVNLERESDRQGGGIVFEYILAASPTPPPYEPLPEFGPPRTAPAGPGGPAMPTPAMKPALSAPAVRPNVVAPPSARPSEPPPVPPNQRLPLRFGLNLPGGIPRQPNPGQESRP